uniref:Uncharacterized protein n=1 Tax=Romanomermis culicivorax TaxID=13658 RepID=A0A915KAW4_ROMCU
MAAASIAIASEHVASSLATVNYILCRHLLKIPNLIMKRWTDNLASETKIGKAKLLENLATYAGDSRSSLMKHHLTRIDAKLKNQTNSNEIPSSQNNRTKQTKYFPIQLQHPIIKKITNSHLSSAKKHP